MAAPKHEPKHAHMSIFFKYNETKSNGPLKLMKKRSPWLLGPLHHSCIVHTHTHVIWPTAAHYTSLWANIHIMQIFLNIFCYFCLKKPAQKSFSIIYVVTLFSFLFLCHIFSGLFFVLLLLVCNKKQLLLTSLHWSSWCPEIRQTQMVEMHVHESLKPTWHMTLQMDPGINLAPMSPDVEIFYEF